MNQSPPAFPPELLERYPFVRALGRGSFAAVYLGEQRGLARQVVVKVLTEPDEESRRRFVREAKLLARVEHPGVTRVIDHGTLGRVNYLVTVYEPGEPLRGLLADGVPWAWGDAARLMRGIAQALAAVHERGIIHRDLSAGNVLVTERGPVLLDFGMAIGPTATRLTEKGATMGTPRYMSPEMMQGRETTAAADLFACGVLLHELLAGAPPFPSIKLVDLIRRQIADPCVGLPASAPEVPAPLVALMVDLLAKDPAQRPDARSAAARLERVLAERPRGAARGGRASGVPPGERRWGAAALTFAFVISISMLMSNRVWRGPPPVAVLTASPVAPASAEPGPLDRAAALESAARVVAPGGRLLRVEQLVEALEKLPAGERGAALAARACAHPLVRALAAARDALAERPWRGEPAARLRLLEALSELAKLRLYAQVRALPVPDCLAALEPLAGISTAERPSRTAHHLALLDDRLMLVRDSFLPTTPAWHVAVDAPTWARAGALALELELHRFSDSQPYVEVEVKGGELTQHVVLCLDLRDARTHAFFRVPLDPAVAQAPRLDVTVAVANLPLSHVFTRLTIALASLVGE